MEPLVVGWGWGDARTIQVGSDFLDQHEWLGTHDPAAYLSVPKAIEFQRQHSWHDVRGRCHDLAVEVVERGSQLRGVARVHGNDDFVQMALLELLTDGDVKSIQRKLYDKFRIEIPVLSWHNRRFIRASLQAYNTQEDVRKLIEGLMQLGELPP